MGQRIKQLDLEPAVIYLSLAERTKQTIELLAPNSEWESTPKKIEAWMYGAGVSDYLEAINALDNGMNSVVFCGHNPTITEIVTYLSGEYISNMPTCAVAVLEFDSEHWNEVSGGTATLRHYDYPKRV